MHHRKVWTWHLMGIVETIFVNSSLQFWPALAKLWNRAKVPSSKHQGAEHLRNDYICWQKESVSHQIRFKKWKLPEEVKSLRRRSGNGIWLFFLSCALLEQGQWAGKMREQGPHNWKIKHWSGFWIHFSHLTRLNGRGSAYYLFPWHRRSYFHLLGSILWFPEFMKSRRALKMLFR